jgi:hypothetical protein
MDSQRPLDVSPEAMQARIQQARREAETLKDRIKRKKDELADTTRESRRQSIVLLLLLSPSPLLIHLYAPLSSAQLLTLLFCP